MRYNRIFIASSSELKQERMGLVDLLQDLNDEVEERGTRFKPVLWEYMDSSMGAKRKEEEYLEELRLCEICLVLFWRTLGEYTVEELDVAVAEMQAGRSLKRVYVLFKDPCNDISKELVVFKESFSQKYPCVPVLTFQDENILRKLVEKIIYGYEKNSRNS